MPEPVTMGAGYVVFTGVLAIPIFDRQVKQFV